MFIKGLTSGEPFFLPDSTFSQAIDVSSLPMKQLPKIFIITVWLTLCLSSHTKGETPPLAQRGIIDLRNANLFGKSLSLNGEWAFYWNHLLSPDSLSSANPDYVPFPVLWNDLQLRGRQVPSTGYATYTLTILLPAKRPRLGMEIPDTYCALKLYVNGIVQAQYGKPATTKETATPFWVTRTCVIPMGEPDTLVLVMQVANFWHARGGPYKEILIGDKDELMTKKSQDTAYDFMLCGCLLMGGLFFLGLYVFGRNDTTILYFALFCLVYSYRMVGTDRYAIHALFTGVPWFISIRAEYLTLSVGIALFCAYTRKLYPDDARPVVMGSMVAFCLLYTALILFSPTLVFTRF